MDTTWKTLDMPEGANNVVHHGVTVDCYNVGVIKF